MPPILLVNLFFSVNLKVLHMLAHGFRFFVFACFFFSSFLQASVITPTAVDKFFSFDKTDLLTLAAPNTSGVSFNYFSQFNVNRPLEINNLPAENGSGHPATLIIIKADTINLSSSVKLLGEKADLLLINANGGSQFYCGSCQFSNFYRVTLAFASMTQDATQTPQILTPLTNSTLHINSLNAAGVAALDLVATQMNLTGKINTQLKANYGADGGFQLNESGNLLVGYGNVNIFNGLKVGYLSQEFEKMPVSIPQLTINSIITTAAAQIVSANTVLVTGSVNTTSDMLSSITYNKKIAAIEESIKITTLKQDADIIHNGTLHTDNKLQLASGGRLLLNGVITGRVLNAIVAGDFIGRGTVDVTHVELTARSIENNGKFLGKVVQLAGEGSVQNRFGGKIFADVISVTSRLGVVRNGSQYPFKPKDDVALVLRPDDPSNIDLGTINGMPFTGATKVSDLSAQIIGKKISIKASQNVENINPYFEFTLDFTNWKSGVPNNTSSADQVLLIAENELDIHSDTYVLNSSAIVGVNNPNGHFYVVAPHIANERYNTQVVIQPFSRVETINNTPVTTTGTGSELVVFSPPGVIYSYAPLGFNFTINNGGFINNTAYFEVLNDAKFFTGPQGAPTNGSKITSIGLALQEKLASRSSYVTIDTASHCKGLASSNSGGSGEAYSRCLATKGYNSFTNLDGQVEEQMYGTLFSVKGNINGAASSFYGTNHKTIEEMSKRVIADEIARNTGIDVNYSTSGHNYNGKTTASLSADGNYIEVSAIVSHVDAVAGATASYNSSIHLDKGKINVADFIKQKFESLKATLMSWLTAFNTWLNS
jgi:haemagglutination activity domain